jgi:hypothetical protein
MAQNLCSFVGPLTVGLLMSRFGVDVALYAIGASYAVSAALVPPAPERLASGSGRRPLQELAAGFRYLRETPCVAWLVSLFFLVPFAGMYFAMVPVYAHEILDVGPAGLGILTGAWGAGTAVGSGYLAWNSELRRGGVRVTAFGVGFGVLVIAFAVSQSMLVSVLVAFASGIVGMLWQNTLSALVQTEASAEMKGRAMSIGTMGIQLMTAAWLFAGAMSAVAGPVATVVFAGAAFAVLSIGAYARSAEIRAVK